MVISLNSSILAIYLHGGGIQMFGVHLPVPESNLCQIILVIFVYCGNMYISLLEWAIFIPNLSAFFILYRVSKDFESYRAQNCNLDKVY